MKKNVSTPGRTLALMSLSLFAVLWAVWFFGYRYFLVWLEGFSYFSTLPDFMDMHEHIQYGFLTYIGSFLHQFYAMPAAGAAIQAFIGTWIVVCTGVVIIRIFKNAEGALWMSFIPLPFFIFIQFWDLQMVNSVFWLLVMTALLVLVIGITLIKRPQLQLPAFICWKPLNITALVIASAVSIYMLLFMDPRNKVHEEQVYLEYLGEHHKWEQILKEVSPRDAASDDLKKRYALLALSETGKLTDYAFAYGLSNSDDFIFYENINPLCLNFNALFYQCLDMHNAVIHQAYQQGVQSQFGVSFSTLRRLADTYLELEDYELAKKYIDILSHSFCHKKWVKERIPELEAIRDAEPEYVTDEYKATISNFTHTISSMVDMNRGDRKYADLYFCSILADEDAFKFKERLHELVPVLYPSGVTIPRLYEEALILISAIDPSATDGLKISDSTLKAFDEYANMMNGGKGTQALRRFAGTYWVYSYTRG